MGQFFSWLRGTQDSSALENVAVEQQSQPKQSTSTPSVPVVKPAQHEKGAASSPSFTTGAAAKPATTTALPTAATSSVTNVGASTGAKVSGGVSTTTPGSSTATSTTTGSSKVTLQNTAVSTSKPEPSKVTSTTGTVVSGTTVQKDDVKSKDTKVKSDVSAKTSMAPAVDPLDALAGSLPSANPRKSPQFTGPEVTEPSLTSSVASRCGDRDDTLPPGYRLKDMEKKMPAGLPEKPKEVSKPLTQDEAVDSLSAGFVSSPPATIIKSDMKPERVAAVDTRKNYAPAPPTQKKQDVTVPAIQTPAPPADKKPKIEKADPMSLDALEALVGTLPEAKPEPESPKLRPDQIVDEKKLKSEKGVLVGERDDTLPPEYRFKEDKNKKPHPPPPPKEPSMDAAEALDILSGDFSDVTVAPAVQTPVPPKTQAKQPQVEDLSALDALAGDFVAPAHAKKVCSATPASKPTPPTPEQADPMSLDALETLGDLLPTAKPVPESPKLRPEEIVNEATLLSEKGVRVGERDDTLPPEYRFPKEDLKKQPPPPKKEPSLDPIDALDILSGDFTSSSTAPVVQAQVLPSAPPADSSADFDLEDLASDFVAPTSAPAVKSAVSAPSAPGRQADPMSLDALEALGDLLPDAKPVPESPKLKAEEIIHEPKLKPEKGVRVGERDDTLPADFRFPKEDPKKHPPPPKKEPSMDPADALDILSGDFTSSAAAPVVQTSSSADIVAPTRASKVSSAAPAPTTMDRQLSEGTTSAMDALSDSLNDIRPAPEPAPVLPKNIVKEKKVMEERVSKPGETDDSLPPEYRLTEAEKKAAAEAKAKAAAAPKQPSFDDSKALDILSGDFGSEVPATPPAPQCKAPAAKTSTGQKESGPVMDKLAGTLLPEDFSDPKKSDSKPKGKGRKSAPKKPAAGDAPVVETLPFKPSTDVVSSSPVKKGGKS